MHRVADWQLAHPSRHRTTDWTQGAYFAGLSALAALSPEARYEKALIAFCEANRWQLGPRPYHADDHCVGQAYLELYGRYKRPWMIEALRKRFDWILEHPSASGEDLDFSRKGSTDQWSWCDALFMAPPAWAKLSEATGDAKYLDQMHREWWRTAEFLYDRKERLFYRDSTYFDRREANGRKVFWSRGNGWVLAGLTRVLQSVPESDPLRKRYVRLFREMAARIGGLQGTDGLWRSSLLDPASYPAPETSGTGFFTYALAWGVNAGLLEPARYSEVALRGWKGLLSRVTPEGMLGSCQPIGSDPRKIKPSDTEVYGTGAFLLAGSEIYRMVGGRSLRGLVREPLVESGERFVEDSVMNPV